MRLKGDGTREGKKIRLFVVHERDAVVACSAPKRAGWPR